MKRYPLLTLLFLGMTFSSAPADSWDVFPSLIVTPRSARSIVSSSSSAIEVAVHQLQVLAEITESGSSTGTGNGFCTRPAPINFVPQPMSCSANATDLFVSANSYCAKGSSEGFAFTQFSLGTEIGIPDCRNYVPPEACPDGPDPDADEIGEGGEEVECDDSPPSSPILLDLDRNRFHLSGGPVLYLIAELSVKGRAITAIAQKAVVRMIGS